MHNLESKLSALRKFFKDMIQDPEKEITWDETCPEFNIGHRYSICPPDDQSDKWLVLEWHETEGTYWDPPDCVESEVGSYDTFTEAVKATYMHEAEARFNSTADAITEEAYYAMEPTEEDLSSVGMIY